MAAIENVSRQSERDRFVSSEQRIAVVEVSGLGSVLFHSAKFSRFGESSSSPANNSRHCEAEK